MPEFKDQRELPYHFTLLYELVRDIESYPNFLPACTGTEIIEPEKKISDELSILTARMELGAYRLSESFISRVEMRDNEIISTQESGPFTHLKSCWKFTAKDNNNCLVEYSIDFSFRGKMLQMMFSSYFESACRKVLTAFQKEAERRAQSIQVD